jgi:hypothetical protein
LDILVPSSGKADARAAIPAAKGHGRAPRGFLRPVSF